MNTISVENVVLFHKKIVSKTGGSDDVRDISLIESALSRAHMTFDNEELYKTIELKISVITHSLIKNHGFVDAIKE